MTMKKLLLIFAFISTCLTGYGLDVILNSGEELSNVNLLSKDQYGINIFDHKDEASGRDIRRHIRFTDMSVATLRFFPYCDSKTTERLASALTDRAAIAQKKYLANIQKTEQDKSFAKDTSIPGGVTTMNILFVPEKQRKNGTIGWAYEDKPELTLVGKIFVYGILLEKDHIWVSQLYLTGLERNIDDVPYKVFTIYRDALADDDEEMQGGEAAPERPARPPRGGG